MPRSINVQLFRFYFRSESISKETKASFCAIPYAQGKKSVSPTVYTVYTPPWGAKWPECPIFGIAFCQASFFPCPAVWRFLPKKQFQYAAAAPGVSRVFHEGDFSDAQKI